MTLTRLLAALRTRFDGFSQDRSGVSAIEFAVLAPLMITLYLGGVEVTQAVAADRKTTLVAHTVADLVARSTTVSNAEMSDILKASATVVTPYSVANLKVTVTSVLIDGAGKATVAWSDTLNGTARTPGSAVALPAALAVPNTSLIWGEVSYAYKPVFGWVLTGTLNLSDATFMRPRLTSAVTRTT